MGAKSWMLVYSDGKAAEALAAKQPLDRAASEALAQRIFPGFWLEPLADGNMASTNPPDDEVLVGCFPGVSVIAASDFAIDRPSTLPWHFVRASPHPVVHLHAMHSVVDWFGFGVWASGRLRRAFSVSPDDGVIEDIGAPLPFELPYREGAHPVDDPDGEVPAEDRYPLDFHPLELGDAALREFFGYQLEGSVDTPLLADETVPLMRFRRVAPVEAPPRVPPTDPVAQYRARGLWGGAFIGGAAGALAGGSLVDAVGVAAYLGAIGLGAGACAAVGWLFVEVLRSRANAGTESADAGGNGERPDAHDGVLENDA